MLYLPETFRVHLVHEQLVTPAGPDLLVVLTLRSAGRDYYGMIAGLSDDSGLVVLLRSSLEDQYRDDQKAFPMDYRIALGDCDPRISLLLRGGEDFAQQRSQLEKSPIVDVSSRELYARARNSLFWTASTTVDLDEDVGGKVLDVTLRVRRRSQSAAELC